MTGDRWLSLTVGGFVLLALAMFAVSILSLSAERGIWSPRYELVARFDDVQGLVRGAPVWLAGKNVGRVGSITFGEAGDEGPPVEVVLHVDTDVQERIRSDSVAGIGTIGLLGDRYVEVSMGTQAGHVLEDGDELGALQPVSLDDVIEKGTSALDSMASLAANLNRVVGQFEGEMGAQKLARAVDAASEMVAEVREGDGLLHSLIYDRYQGGGVESIERSLASLEKILKAVESGDGILHTLVFQSPGEQDLVMQTLEAGARLNSILEKIDRGEGTLGLILNDPTLYEDVKQLIGGAERSRLLRTLIRMAIEADQ